jgi:DNA-binding HxlR family transcriptional regulator
MLKAKNTRHSPEPIPPVYGMVEDVVGCKWSLLVLELVRRGVSRPGAMERSVEGLTTKVLNERLKKLVRYEILQREVFPEVPPRVEYHLTPFGQRFSAVLDAIRDLGREIDRESEDACERLESDGRPRA